MKFSRLANYLYENAVYLRFCIKINDKKVLLGNFSWELENNMLLITNYVISES